MFFSSITNALSDALTNPDDTELVYRKDIIDDTIVVQPMRTHLEIRNGLPQSDFDRTRAAEIRGRQQHRALGFKNEVPTDSYAFTPSTALINSLDLFPPIIDQCWRGNNKSGTSEGELPSILKLIHQNQLQNTNLDQIEFQMRQHEHNLDARTSDFRGMYR